MHCATNCLYTCIRITHILTLKQTNKTFNNCLKILILRNTLNGAFNDTHIMTTAITLNFKCSCFTVIKSAIVFVQLQKTGKNSTKMFYVYYFNYVI